MRRASEFRAAAKGSQEHRFFAVLQRCQLSVMVHATDFDDQSEPEGSTSFVWSLTVMPRYGREKIEWILINNKEAEPVPPAAHCV